MLTRIGAATVQGYIDALIAYTERRTIAEIARLPRGVFAADGMLDSDGFTDQPVRLAAQITIDEQGILFDLTGSDLQRRAPVNATYAQTFSACAYALKCLIDPDVPTNHGFYRQVRLIAPAGTVVNCSAPAPVVAGWEINLRLTDVLLKALAPALPNLIPAGTKAMICHAGFGGIAPGSGQYYCFLETLAGGYGGRAGLMGQTRFKPTGRTPRTRRSRKPRRTTRYGSRAMSWWTTRTGRGAGAAGWACAATTYSPTTPRRLRSWPTATAPARGGCSAGSPASAPSMCSTPTANERRLGSKTTVELSPAT